MTPSSTVVRSSVRACIFKNLAVMVGVQVVCLLLLSVLPAARNVASSSAFAVCAMILGLVSLGVLLFGPRGRSALALVFVSTLMASVALASRFDGGVVLQSLLVVGILFSTMAYLGYRHDGELDRLGGFLFVGLLALVIGSIVNLFVRSDPTRLALSWVGVFLFSGFVFHDVNHFSRHCEGDDCCTRGTLSLWLDFVNLFNDVLIVNGS